MAQAEEKNTRKNSHILIQLQAPEAAIPQVLVKEHKLEKNKSHAVEKKHKKKFMKLFSKGKSINDVKASVDARVMSHRNYLNNF